jgi:hypothetical protein
MRSLGGAGRARRGLLTAGIVGLLAAVAVGSLAVGSRSHADAGAAGPSDAVKASVALLRTVPDAAGAIPPGIAAGLDTPPAGAPQTPAEQPDYAWKVQDPALDGTVYVVAKSNGTTCLAAAAALACGDDAQVAGGDLVTVGRNGTDAAGTAHIAGLVPDGVQEVAATLIDGRAVGARVVENVFALRVAGEPTALSWTGPNGPHTVRIRVPAEQEPAAVKPR